MQKTIKTHINNSNVRHFIIANYRIILINIVYFLMSVYFLLSIFNADTALEKQFSLYMLIAVIIFIIQSITFKNRNISYIIHASLYPVLFLSMIVSGLFIEWTLLFSLIFPIVVFTLFDRKLAWLPLTVMTAIWLMSGILLTYGVIPYSGELSGFRLHFFMYLIITVFSSFLAWFWDYQIQTALKNLYFDKLTELPNRHKYMDEISTIPDPFVMLVDIDSFVEINDGFGASVANQIIHDVVKEFRDALFNLEYRLFRLQSDDFLIIFPHQGANKNFDYEQVARIIIQTISETRFEGVIEGLKYDVHITISIGMARAPEYPRIELLGKADTALKNARMEMKSFEIFSSEQDMEHHFKDNMRWLNILTEALQDRRVIPYFQPIFDNISGKVSKHEALVRLISPEGEVISPFYFLGIAQKSRLYPRITQTMFNSVVNMITNTGTDISINLSIRDIFHTETVMIIENTLNRHPFVARHLIFELLETYQLEHSPQLATFIYNMKSKGVRFAIDDFGSGYSNYEYILRLNLDYLKIAGDLVKDIHQIAESRILVENISSFAHKLGIKTIAEFVHNEEVYNIIKDIGVDFSQGFFLGKPEEKLVLTD